MASLMTISNQVAREGARWGLYPIIRDGKVKVCARVAQLPTRANAPKIVEYTHEVVASLDENSGLDAWSAVLLKRLTRFSGNIFNRAMAQKKAKEAAEQEEINARRRSFRAWLKRSSNRIISVNGLNPDGSALGNLR